MCHNIPVRSAFVTSDVHTFPFYKNSCLLTQSFCLFLNASQCKSRTRNWWPLFALGGGVQIKILRRGRHLLFASHPRNRGTRWHISTHSAGDKSLKNVLTSLVETAGQRTKPDLVPVLGQRQQYQLSSVTGHQRPLTSLIGALS